jgi:hypothetical protein
MNTSWLNHSGHVSAIPRISRTIPGISGTFPRNSGKQSNHKSKNLESTNMCIQLLNSMFFSLHVLTPLSSVLYLRSSVRLSQFQNMPKITRMPYATFSKKGTKLKKRHKWECSICTFVWAILWKL